MNQEMLKQRLAALRDPKAAAKANRTNNKEHKWTPPTGESTVRIVPSLFNRDSPFKEIELHYLTKRTMIGLSQFGEKDPIVEFAKELQRGEDWKLGKKLMPKTRVMVPVIVRGEENKGVRLWEFGVKIYEQLLAIAADEEVGDITDPVSGRDLKVETTSPEQNKTEYPQTTVRIKLTSTPLSTDPEKIKTWLENQPNPIDMYPKFTYDQMKTALEEHLNPSNTPEVPKEGESVEQTTIIATTDTEVKTSDKPAKTSDKPKKKVEVSQDIDDLFKI